MRARGERRLRAIETPTVEVTPKNDDIRKYLYHPLTKIRFPEQGPARWPDDTFTQRRVRDGDITVKREETAAPAAKAGKTS